MNFIRKNIIKKIYKDRLINSHKGDHGRILCIGGSEDYTGAPFLAINASIAMLRTGVDIATVIAPTKVAFAINSLNPDIITKKIDCKYFTEKFTEEVIRFSQAFDCVLIGPGIGQHKQTFSLY